MMIYLSAMFVRARPNRHMKVWLNLISSLMVLQCQAQRLDQQLSRPHEVENQAYYTEIIGRNQHGIYVRKFPQDDRKAYSEILRFDNGLRLRNQRQFDMQPEQSLLFTAMLDHTPIIITSQYSNKTDVTSIMGRLLRPGLEDSTENIFLFELKDSDQYGHVRIALSEQGDQIGFCLHEQGDKPQLRYYLYDQHLSKLAEQVSPLPDNPMQLMAFHFEFPWAIASIKPRRGKKQMRRQQLLIKNLARKEDLTYQLFKDSTSIAEPNISWHPRDSIFYITGLYQRDKQDVFEGVFWEKVLTKREVMGGHFLPFDQALKEDINGVLSSLDGLRNLKLRSVVHTADHHLMLTAEQVSVSSQTVSDYNVYNTAQTYTRYYYNFMDVITMSITPDNHLAWYNVLKKDQTSVNDAGYYSSFAQFVYPNQVQYYYNDLYRKRANLTKYVVYPNGESESEIIVRGAEFPGRFIPKEGKQVSAYELFIPAYYQKEGAYLLKIHQRPE